MYVSTFDQLMAALAELVATGGAWETPKWALFTNDVFPSLDMALDDFTIDDFGGLTNLKAVVWQTPFRNNQGQAEVRAAMLSWLTTTTPPDTVTAYGWVETNAAGDTLLRAERFATPVLFTGPSQELSLVPVLRLGNT